MVIANVELKQQTLFSPFWLLPPPESIFVLRNRLLADEHTKFDANVKIYTKLNCSKTMCSGPEKEKKCTKFLTIKKRIFF